jgi:hypothetical protein
LYSVLSFFYSKQRKDKRDKVQYAANEKRAYHIDNNSSQMQDFKQCIANSDKSLGKICIYIWSFVDDEISFSLFAIIYISNSIWQ